MPVAGIGLPPSSIASGVLLSAEVVLVLGFREPSPLTGSLAGLTATRFTAVALLVAVAEIRAEQLLTVKAFATTPIFEF